MSIPFSKRIRITAARRREWYEVLASMTSKESGLTVPVVLKDMHGEFKSIGHPMEPVVKQLIMRMRGAKGGVEIDSLRLGDSLKGLVPPNEAMMIKAGEERGDVSRGLSQAAAYVASSDALLGLVQKSLAISGIYFLCITLINIFFSVALLPKMQTASPRYTWPGYAQTYGWVADHMIIIACLFVVFVIVGWFIFLYLLKNWKSSGREFADRRVWPFTTVRLMNASALLMSVSGFVKVGAPFVEAIQIVAAGANPYMASRFKRIKGAMRGGAYDYDALVASKLIPESWQWIIRCYGRSSDFGVALEMISTEFVQYALKRTGRVAAMINFALLLLVAANIGWIGLTVTGIVRSVR
ncbi:type II secretion system F family protein [Paracidovorax wautersii]|uniref:Type II secretion system (T2SS), protein F n=1 Tax=Paracidovorax wautersii TaxID=1177982 RepID=A0A1I2HQ36_9BURK|nr:type II secretion system F family protein [Paracidovorax wautersii]SFF31959.1 Type II secretion system (T2SS), protein F [Paracidovorax wautersii]